MRNHVNQRRWLDPEQYQWQLRSNEIRDNLVEKYFNYCYVSNTARSLRSYIDDIDLQLKRVDWTGPLSDSDLNKVTELESLRERSTKRLFQVSKVVELAQRDYMNWYNSYEDFHNDSAFHVINGIHPIYPQYEDPPLFFPPVPARPTKMFHKRFKRRPDGTWQKLYKSPK